MERPGAPALLWRRRLLARPDERHWAVERSGALARAPRRGVLPLMWVKEMEARCARSSRQVV